MTTQLQVVNIIIIIIIIIRNIPTLQSAQTAHRMWREVHHTPSSAEVKNE